MVHVGAPAALPPVEQVRPGLWSIPVPIPIPLRYVLVYAFETPRGPYLIDAGWASDESFDALGGGLRRAGFEITDVKGVMVTHVHDDHYPLAGWVRECSDAWIALHPADAQHVQQRYERPMDYFAWMEPELRRLGAPESECMRSPAVPPSRSAPSVEPTVLMEDGDKPEIPGWDLTAVWTPGHTPGHLCFWEARHRLLLTGDCVLSSLSSGVSLSPTSGPDPLGAYLDSLARLADFDVDEALPAHEFRFRNFAARLRQVRAFHEARLADVVASVPDGRDTAWAIAAHLDWGRPWHLMGDLMRRVAIGETNAHLRALAERGVLEEVDGEPVRWRIIGDIEKVSDLVG